MSFYWFNRFNLIEGGGPFATIEAAKLDAVEVYENVQNGFAFDIAITDGPDPSAQVIENGHIKKGRWIDGDFSETQKEAEERMGAE